MKILMMILEDPHTYDDDDAHKDDDDPRKHWSR